MVAGDPGETHILVNVGNPTLSLPHDDANSTAANRFSTAAGATVVLRSAGSLMVVYDSITARWKVLGP